MRLRDGYIVVVRYRLLGLFPPNYIIIVAAIIVLINEITSRSRVKTTGLEPQETRSCIAFGIRAHLQPRALEGTRCGNRSEPRLPLHSTIVSIVTISLFKLWKSISHVATQKSYLLGLKGLGLPEHRSILFSVRVVWCNEKFDSRVPRDACFALLDFSWPDTGVGEGAQRVNLWPNEELIGGILEASEFVG